MASLLDELEEDERKEKEVKSKQAKEAALRALAIHPLMKEKRDIRDAYFYGLTFAAIADDGKVDVAEKTILSSIAKSLGLPDGEVEEAISELHGKSAKDKMQLITECVKALADNKVGLNLFWAQFIQVWSSHADSKDVLSRLLKRIAEQSGVRLPASKVSAILSLLKGGDGVDNDMLVLAYWMGDAALKYFAVKKYGDVTDIVATERKRRETMKAKKMRDEKERIDAARKSFATVIEMLSENHRYEPSLRRGWDACLKDNLSIFDKKDIDWVSECRSRLRALMSTCAEKAIFPVRRRILRRKLVWKLMCMQYVYGKDVYATEVNNMLQAAAKQSDDRFRARIEKFISDTFADDVVLK